MPLPVPGQFHRLLRLIPADIPSRILLHTDFAQLLRLLHVTFVRFLAAQKRKRIAAFFLRVQPCLKHVGLVQPLACMPLRCTLALLCMRVGP